MFHLRFFQSNVCLKTLLFALPKCLRLKLSYCLDISLEMSIFDKCVACAGRVYGERCNEESVRNKLLFFRGKLEEQRQAVNEWRCASVCGCWWQRGTCTHTHIIWCIYYIFIYVHVSSIKTCFDVLIIVQLLLYIYIYIYVYQLFLLILLCQSKSCQRQMHHIESYLCFPQIIHDDKKTTVTRGVDSWYCFVHGIFMGYFDVQSFELNDYEWLNYCDCNLV